MTPGWVWVGYGENETDTRQGCCPLDRLVGGVMEVCTFRFRVDLIQIKR